MILPSLKKNFFIIIFLFYLTLRHQLTIQKVFFLLSFLFLLVNDLLKEPENIALILEYAEVIAINIYLNRNILQSLPLNNETFLIILISYLLIKFIMNNISIQNYINLSFDQQYDLLESFLPQIGENNNNIFIE